MRDWEDVKLGNATSQSLNFPVSLGFCATTTFSAVS